MDQDHSTTPAALTHTQAASLEKLENTIQKGIQTFVEVGLALREIRDKKLYLQGHSTFEEYLRVRWEMSRAHGYRLMKAAEVSKAVSPAGDIPERVLRPLSKLEPEARREALSKAKAAAGDKPVTSEHVEAAVARRPRVPKFPRLGPPSNGLDFARMAIMDLGKIRSDDIERKAALDLVEGWIHEHDLAPNKYPAIVSAFEEVADAATLLVTDLMNENKPEFKLLSHEGAFIRAVKALKALKVARERLVTSREESRRSA